MAKSQLKLVTPAAIKRTVTPTRRPNDKLRTREYLTEAEIERLMAAAKRNRWGHRDATMVLAAYRHGLRASELVDLRWAQVKFDTATLHVRRVKQGTLWQHILVGEIPREIVALTHTVPGDLACRVMMVVLFCPSCIVVVRRNRTLLGSDVSPSAWPSGGCDGDAGDALCQER